MNYIVFDLEWNQPADIGPVRKNKLSFEIIEIGAVKLDENKRIISKFSELVKPRVYNRLNWRTEKMLHISMRELRESGAYFSDVVNRFLKWCGEDYIFCTWGSQDLSELQKNLKYFHLRNLSNGPIKYYDVQKLFAAKMNEDGTSRSLETAVDMLELDKDIPFHRAYSDAYYTAKIFSKIDDNILNNNFAYDLFHLPKDELHEIYEENDNGCYYVSSAYKDREDITNNRRMLGINCPKCKWKVIRPKVRWFSTNSKIYYGAAICIKHGPIKGKLRIKKHDNGLYFLEKFIEYTNYDEVNAIKEKKYSLKNKVNVNEEHVNEDSQKDKGSKGRYIKKPRSFFKAKKDKS